MNRSILLIYIGLGLGLLQTPLAAQQYVDILNIGYYQNANANYRNSSNELQQNGLWANLKAPIQLNDKKDYLICSVNYSSVYLKHEVYANDPLRLHDLGLDVGYLKKWNNPAFSSYISANLAFASDFSKKTKGAINYNSTVLLIYKKKESISWNLGFNYRIEAFGNIFTPLVGFNWQINEQLNLSFLSFSHLKVEYQFSDRVGAGLRMQNTAFSFTLPNFGNISNSVIHNYSDTFPFPPQKVFAYVDLYLTDHFVVFGRTGYEFAKEIIHTDVEDDTNEESSYNGKVNAGLLFEIGAAWRIRLNR